jgi:hypothetical protein
VSKNICSEMKILFPRGRGEKRQGGRLALAGHPCLAFEHVPEKVDSLQFSAGACSDF